MDDRQEIIEIIPTDAPDIPEAQAGVLDVSGPMLLWTWVTFLIVAFLLYKFAWRPILTGLDRREDGLREAVKNAEHLQREMAELDEKKAAIIQAAEQEAKDEIAAGRKAAAEAARNIEHRAKEESRILFENAQREIRTEQAKAADTLRRDSADVAVRLASRILDEELDDAKRRALTDKLLKEV